MPDKKQDLIDQKLQDLNNDGVDRRGFLKCMAWAGTGLVWTLSGGIPVSRAFAKSDGKDAGKGADFSFVQISDSHIGFNKPANPDVTATLQTAINKINAMPQKPDFIIHTGDLSQLSKPSEFDTLDQVLKGASAKQIYFVPGEHDMLSDNGEQYLQRYGKGTKGAGWSSFDHKGVHFVGLVNVANLKAGGMGSLGHEQLEWLEDDLKGRSASTPIVLYAHIPLWTIYPDWGWGTDDSEQALVLCQAFRLRDCVERAYSPDHAEDRRQGFVPHCDVDRVPSTCAGNSSLGRADESARRAIAAGIGYHRCELCGQRWQPRNRRFATRSCELCGFRQCRRLLA